MEAITSQTTPTRLIKKGESGPEPALRADERPQNWLARVNQAFGVEDAAVGQYLISTLSHVFRKDVDIDMLVNGLVGLIKEMQPQDGLERMALVQMTLVNNACLQQASRSYNASQFSREEETSQMCRLMRLYMQQMAAFRKYRNKASQNITVNYVQSANTVVGDVHTNG